MKIAISTDGDFVSAHFGRCPSFTIADVDNGKLVNKETIANPGHQPGFIPQFLNEMGVKAIICGGMGARATMLFDQYGIQTILGVSCAVDEAIDKFALNALASGESLCSPGAGKGYGLDKSVCDHPNEEECERQD